MTNRARASHGLELATEVGISFATGTIEGNAGATVWTQDFGSHAC